ncbi:MAG: hypothetical protein EHM39_10290 [Chloroflexi bacterium]|nr:MAG: hypothetical protein EHM39_10290 [Chloroflexota bacterium]
MATLQQAIDEIQAVVGAVPGIRQAPTVPPEDLSFFPFAVAFVEAGEWIIGPPELMTGLHTVVIELHVARKDLPRDVTAAMRYAKAIPNAILDAHRKAEFTAFQTFERITYEFAALGWNDTATLGFRFRIERLKTQDAIT